MTILPRGWRRLRSLWHTAHLKSRGMYSVDRLNELNLYLRRVSTPSMASVLFWTSLPALLITFGTDLFRLAPPEFGYRHQTMFWLRVFVIASIMLETLMLQLSIFLPSLNMRIREITLITLFTSSSSTGCMILFSSQIGFPLPFAITLVSPYSMACLCSCTALRYGRQMLSDATLRSQLLEYFIFMSLQYGVTVVYPIYAYIFLHVHSVVGQTLLACFLPLTKLLLKIAMAHAMPSLPELRPSFLMFNVEVFNALFIASCLQNASSVVTTVIIMVLDAFFNVITLREVTNRLSTLNKLLTTRDAEVVVQGVDWIECAVYLLRDENTLGIVKNQTQPHTNTSRASVKSLTQIMPTVPPQTSTKTHQSVVAVAPHGQNEPRNEHLDNLTSEQKIALVNGVLELLYTTEFVSLTEYIEVIVPVIYATFLAVGYQLPNRIYYPQLREASADENARAIQHILAYALSEFVSLLIFERLLQRQMRLNPLRQLAFVLAEQWWFLPMKLMLWVAFILPSSIVHYGIDYTFHFKWLQSGA